MNGILGKMIKANLANLSSEQVEQLVNGFVGLLSFDVDYIDEVEQHLEGSPYKADMQQAISFMDQLADSANTLN